MATTVGHKRPPIHSRFTKGVSGNPKGRPKGKKSMSSLIRKALNKKISVNENGTRRRMTRGEAMVIQYTNKATQGDISALRFLLNLNQLSISLDVQSEADSDKIPTVIVLSGPDLKM